MISSPRILKICEFVTFNVIAEIGCDHAYITKNLFAQGKIKFAYLTDISDKCLQKAKVNLQENNKNTFFSVGNGLEALNVLDSLRYKEKNNNLPCSFSTLKNITEVGNNINEVEKDDKHKKPKSLYTKVKQVVIAGMGGQEIIKILMQDTKKQYKNFVLQPQKNVKELRTFLQENNFLILKDDIIQEGKMFYFVLSVKRANKKMPHLSTFQQNFGLPQDKNVFKNYLIFEKNKLQEILKKKSILENEKLLELINEQLKNLIE